MGMSAKSRRQLTELAEELMEPGDRTVHLMRAQVGKTPVKKNVGAAAITVAASVAVAAIGGGMSMGMLFVKGDVFIAVTDRKVLIFGGRRNRPGPGRLWANAPRDAVTVISEKDKFLNHKLLLGVPGAEQPLRLTLAPINPSIRNDGRRLAQLLRQSSPATDPR
jgi:hypothetical protein